LYFLSTQWDSNDFSAKAIVQACYFFIPFFCFVHHELPLKAAELEQKCLQFFNWKMWKLLGGVAKGAFEGAWGL
jgi:hypothetical protein